MKSLQVVLVTGVAVLALGAAVVTTKYLATDSAEIESARSVIVDQKMMLLNILRPEKKFLIWSLFE